MDEIQKKYEAIVRQVESINPQDYAKGGKLYVAPSAAQTAPGDVLKKICDLYHKVKGVLEVVVNLPIIPKNIRDAIKTFMSLLDSICAS